MSDNFFTLNGNDAAEMENHVNQVAKTAAMQYPNDMDAQIDQIAAAWEAKLTHQVQANQQGNVTPLAAEPIGPGFYQWWNVLVAGPFQAIGPGGAFAPNKIIRGNEPAFLLAAIVRNPAPLPGSPVGPSAAQIMAGFDYCVRTTVGNVTTWQPGPAQATQNGTFGGGFIDILRFDLQGLPQPADCQPNLYEANLVMDIDGPVAGLPPFAGYATWVLDPDYELPDLLTPGQGPRLQHDIPVRFLHYT